MKTKKAVIKLVSEGATLHISTKIPMENIGDLFNHLANVCAQYAEDGHKIESIIFYEEETHAKH